MKKFHPYLMTDRALLLYDRFPEAIAAIIQFIQGEAEELYDNLELLQSTWSENEKGYSLPEWLSIAERVQSLINYKAEQMILDRQAFASDLFHTGVLPFTLDCLARFGHIVTDRRLAKELLEFIDQ